MICYDTGHLQIINSDTSSYSTLEFSLLSVNVQQNTEQLSHNCQSCKNCAHFFVPGQLAVNLSFGTFETLYFHNCVRKRVQCMMMPWFNGWMVEDVKVWKLWHNDVITGCTACILISLPSQHCVVNITPFNLTQVPTAGHLLLSTKLWVDNNFYQIYIYHSNTPGKLRIQLHLDMSLLKWKYKIIAIVNTTRHKQSKGSARNA